MESACPYLQILRCINEFALCNYHDIKALVYVSWNGKQLCIP